MRPRRMLAGRAARWTAFCLAAWTSPAAAQPATLLFYEVARGGNANAASKTNVADAAPTQTLGGFASDALVFANASGEAHYAGPLTGSGIRVSIVRDRYPIVEDDMFEGQSINMTYRASVSHVCLLPAGKTITLIGRTEPLGPLGSNNDRTAVRLEVTAIAVRGGDVRANSCNLPPEPWPQP